ncbi:hypothetical protein ACJJTC_018706 [Scirpophaga incertulas]
MSPTKKCSGCLGNIKGDDYLQYPFCEQFFDVDCANVPVKKFRAMTKDHKCAWKCPDCAMKQKKIGDNSNTPVRQSSIVHGSAGGSFVEMDDSANVTQCNKSQQSKQSKKGVVIGDIAEERLRSIVRQELAEVMKSTMKRLVREELSNITGQLSSFHDSLTYFNDCFENLKKDNEKSNTIIKKLEFDNNELKINGVPEKKSENLVNVFLRMTQSINYSISIEDVLHGTRVAKLNRDNNRPRSIIAKLRSPRQRDALLAAVASFNKKNPKNKLNSTHLGHEGLITPVYVAEHLTPTNKSLHAAARLKSRDLSYKFVWVRNGRVYVRKEEFSQAIQIKNIDSLKHLEYLVFFLFYFLKS